MAYSELGLYQPLTQDDWGHGLGFPEHQDASGYLSADGHIETGVTGLAMLSAKINSSDTNNNRKNGGVTFEGKFYTWGPNGVRRWTGSVWENVYTLQEVQFILTNGKYIFLCPTRAAGVKATGSITVVTNPNDGDTTIVGQITYTWKTTLSTAPATPREVKIGASTSDSATNLKKAINKEGDEGTHYGIGTPVNKFVTATVSTNVVSLTAISDGAWGNSLVLETDGVRLTDTGMSGGTSGAKGNRAGGTITFVSQPNDGDNTTVGGAIYTWKTTLTGAANEVLIGAAKSNSATNLKKAINDEGTEGTDYGTGTAVNGSVEAQVNTVPANPTVVVYALSYGAGGNLISLTTDGVRLTDGDMANGQDGARMLKSDSGDLNTWSLVGIDANPPQNMAGGVIHAGYHWFFEDSTSFVHYSAAEDLSTLEGNDTKDAAVVTVGAGTVPLLWLESYNNVLYAAREDGLWQIDTATFTAKQVVNFAQERHADNFAAHAVFQGYLLFNIRNKVYQWNGVTLADRTPGPISRTWPLIEWGRWRNFIIRGLFMYALARTNETSLYRNAILKFDGTGWHPVYIGAGYSSTDDWSMLALDTQNNRLWFHLDRASPGTDETFYIQLATDNDLPYPDFPTGLTYTNRLITSEFDMGFKRVVKSAAGVQFLTKGLPSTSAPNSAGPRSGGTFASDASSGGTIPWTSPGNAGAEDSIQALADFSPSGPETSHYLKATNFGFAIPSTATIIGFVVRIISTNLLPSNDPAQGILLGVRLVRSGAVEATEKIAMVNGTANGTEYLFGSSSDRWGNTWTAAIINASNFGVVAKGTTGPYTQINDDLQIDYMSITVYYTVGGRIEVEYNADDLGWKLLGVVRVSPFQELFFSPTLEFYKIAFRLRLVTDEAAVTPILDAMTVRFLLRPKVGYAYQFDLIADDYTEYGAVLDDRTAKEIVETLRAIRDTRRPVECEMLRGEKIRGYLSAVQARPVYEEDDRIEWWITCSLVELV